MNVINTGKILLYYLLIIFLFSACSEKKVLTDQERVQQFYVKHKDTDFNMFKCYSFQQKYDPEHPALRQFNIEYFKNCATSSDYPLRAFVKYEDTGINFSSRELTVDDFSPDFLLIFRDLGVSQLFYKHPNKLILNEIPEIRFMKSCGNKEPGYLSLDRCWHYKILR